jgi:hypothetical protein
VTRVLIGWLLLCFALSVFGLWWMALLFWPVAIVLMLYTVDAMVDS